MVKEGLATCSGEGATTTENTMVMAKFVSEISNGSYSSPAGVGESVWAKHYQERGANKHILQFNRTKLSKSSCEI